jgi:hypothetical protein
MDNALAQCSNFANGKIGTPKEILDTPKENPITPKVTTRRSEELKNSLQAKRPKVERKN